MGNYSDTSKFSYQADIDSFWKSVAWCSVFLGVIVTLAITYKTYESKQNMMRFNISTSETEEEINKFAVKAKTSLFRFVPGWDTAIDKSVSEANLRQFREMIANISKIDNWKTIADEAKVFVIKNEYGEDLEKELDNAIALRKVENIIHSKKSKKRR
jgi:hypothetical protein